MLSHGTVDSVQSVRYKLLAIFLERSAVVLSEGEESGLKFWWKTFLAASVTLAGAALVLSGGSLLESVEDVMLESSDQPASPDPQMIEVLNVGSVDRAIRGNDSIGTAVDDVNFAIEERRLVYVEDELWGVSAVLRLDEMTSLDGPWITVDTESLIESANTNFDAEYISQLPHEEIDHMLSDYEFTSADYTTSADTYEADTELIYVTIQPRSGKVLTLVPHSEPPSVPTS